MTQHDITAKEMERRQLIAQAKGKVLDALSSSPELTPLEWCQVFVELQVWLINTGLKEEWKD